jgi:serine protease inhibitor
MASFRCAIMEEMYETFDADHPFFFALVNRDPFNNLFSGRYVTENFA